MHADLFPETLAVQLVNGVPMTTSVEIATHFGKRHDTVLRAIKTLIERTQDVGRLRNFAATSYPDVQGRPQPMYLLTRDAFIFVVAGFTGEAADEWKWRFIDAFTAMESALHAQATREAQALYQVRPRWKPIAQHPSLSRRDLIALTGHRSPASVTACRRRMRDAGLL